MNMERLARGMRTGSPRKTAATAAKWRHDNFGNECVPVPTGTPFKFPSKRNEESFADDFTGTRLWHVPSHLHLSVLVSGHGHQGRAHWLLFMFEVKGGINIAAAGAFRGRFQLFPRDGAYAAGAGDAEGGAAGRALNLPRFSTLNIGAKAQAARVGRNAGHDSGILCQTTA
jgi:hypothetical protein